MLPEVRSITTFGQIVNESCLGDIIEIIAKVTKYGAINVPFYGGVLKQ